VGAFVALTVAVVLAWLGMVVRTFRAEQRKQLLRRERAGGTSSRNGDLPPGATLPPTDRA
jgi:hypothetical protein